PSFRAAARFAVLHAESDNLPPPNARSVDSASPEAVNPGTCLRFHPASAESDAGSIAPDPSAPATTRAAKHQATYPVAFAAASSSNRRHIQSIAMNPTALPLGRPD